MFRTRVAAAAAVGVAGLTLAACTDDRVELDFEGQLEVGVIAPLTGELDFLGPAQVAAIEIAQAEINAAGGVWGSEVTVEFRDEGDGGEGQVAGASAEALIAAGVDAVIGPAATGATLSVIEPLRDAGIIQISPANPGIVLDDHPARDYYFRTGPSDVLQGAVLGQELLTDAHESVAIVARDDAYGQGLATRTAEAYQAGEGEVVADLRYDPETADPDGTADFAAEAEQIVEELAEAEPDAIVIISFEEGAQLMAALADAELAPADGTGWYLVNANLADYTDALPEGTLEGAKATAPVATGDPTGFHARMDEHAEELTDHTYGTEAYDALIALALGAILANDDDPDAIRQAMIDISREPGEACAAFAECLALIEDGEELNYVGQSGPIDWSDAGDPRQGAIGIYVYDAGNGYSLQRVELGRL